MRLKKKGGRVDEEGREKKSGSCVQLTYIIGTDQFNVETDIFSRLLEWTFTFIKLGKYLLPDYVASIKLALKVPLISIHVTFYLHLIHFSSFRKIATYNFLKQCSYIFVSALISRIFKLPAFWCGGGGRASDQIFKTISFRVPEQKNKRGKNRYSRFLHCVIKTQALIFPRFFFLCTFHGHAPGIVLMKIKTGVNFFFIFFFYLISRENKLRFSFPFNFFFSIINRRNGNTVSDNGRVLENLRHFRSVCKCGRSSFSLNPPIKVSS